MKVISTTKAPAAIGPYSQGYEVNGFVFSSGQIPVNPETGEVPEGIAAQAEQSCKNVGEVLAAAGVGYENVVKTTCFLADMAMLYSSSCSVQSLEMHLEASDRMKGM